MLGCGVTGLNPSSDLGSKSEAHVRRGYALCSGYIYRSLSHPASVIAFSLASDKAGVPPFARAVRGGSLILKLK